MGHVNVPQKPTQPAVKVPIVLKADSVRQWNSKLALESPGTARQYLSHLNTYWVSSLSKNYATIDQYVDQVRKGQESNDIKVRRKWGSDLETFINAYISRYGRPLTKAGKNVIVSSVRHYLKECLGDRVESYDFVLGTKAERLAELRAKENVAPVTIDEIKRIYTETKNRRDAAIISTLVSGGCGVSEWLQFSNEWFRYSNDIREGKVPIRVNVTRPKTMQSYTHFFWDDAVEDLRELLLERERELGRPLTANDPLFANQYAEPINAHDVQKTVRRLAHRSGVEPKQVGKGSYRIRPHEIGKDFFRTQLAIARVASDVAEYLSGHVVDSNAYNKFHRTAEGQELIEKEASKLRPLVNVRTGKGQPHSEIDKQVEFIIQAAKLFNYNEVVHKLEQLRMEGRLLTEADLKPFKDEMLRARQAQQLPPVKKYSNHEYEYVQASMEDEAFQKALEDGYEVVSGNGSGYSVLRRKKDHT